MKTSHQYYTYWTDTRVVNLWDSAMSTDKSVDHPKENIVSNSRMIWVQHITETLKIIDWYHISVRA